jgi:hypothetical protein
MDMAALKIILTPQPAVARVRSAVATSTSGSALKSQFQFESTPAPVTQSFGLQTVSQSANVLVALVMALWRFCTDLGWAGPFLISDGFFSHWQVWIALSIGLKILSSTLIAWGSRTIKLSEEN